MVAQLGNRHLVLAGADVDLIDRHATGNLVHALFQLVQGGAKAVLIAFAHEDDARIADDPVNKILLAGGGDAGLYGPHDADGIAQLLLQGPTGGAGLVFDALVHIAF